MNPEYTAAATKAAETLIKYGINKAPVSPLHILRQMDSVLVVPFAEMCHSGMNELDIAPLFGRNRDAISSVHTENGQKRFVVAYNNQLPFSITQRALAREMGHVLLHHEQSSPENTKEAICFMYHLLCPRALIHAIQATGMRITADLLANMAGIFDQDIIRIRRIPGTSVPSGLNCFVRSQFMPFILNFFDYYQCTMPKDGSAIVDLLKYMDNYEE